MSNVSRFLDPNLLQRLNQIQFSARSVVEGATSGQHRSPVRGASVDFRQHRSYVPGDEPRRLDWRLLARTDRPYVREYQEETNLRATIMLDRSGSMAYGRKFGTKFDYAARLSAAMAYLMLGQNESVGLGIFGQNVDPWLAPHSHPQQLARLLEILERSQPEGPSSPDTGMFEVADRLSKRSMVIVISDLFAPARQIRSGLARLRHDRHEVMVIQVLDPDELEFPFRTHARFKGLEDELPSLCDAALVRQTYLANFQRHQDELRETCNALLGVELTRMVIDRPLDLALMSFLRRRSTSK